MKSFVLVAALISGSVQAMLRYDFELLIREGYNEDSPMENENLMEGDIITDSEEFPSLLYNAITSDSKRWPKGVVPYVIDPSLKRSKAHIRVAMDHIESKVKCIRFVPRNNQNDFVLIVAKDGCYSNIGRSGGKQILSLGAGCDRFGIIVHELTHVLGFDHEHMRFDRDSYIRVFLENIKPKFQGQFKAKRRDEHRIFTAFDYDSIMLYGSKAFAKSRDRPSMTRLDGKTLRETSQKKGLSEKDVQRIHKLYSC